MNASKEDFGIASKAMNSLEELLKSDRTKELENIAKKISHDLAGEIILNAYDSSLTSEIEKLKGYNEKFDWSPIFENYNSFAKKMSKLVPECQTINKYLSKIEEPLNLLSKKYGLCQGIINDNLKLKASIDECISETEKTVKEIYNQVINDKWISQMKYVQDHFKLDIEGDYTIAPDELKIELQTKSPEMLFFKRIKNVELKILDSYNKKLDEKKDYAYVIDELKKSGKIGEEIPYLADIEKMFDDFYIKTRKIKASEEKLSESKEARKEQAASIIKSRTGQLIDFIEGVESYNSLTKGKNIQLQNIEMLKDSYSGRLKQILSEYKQKLDNNEFFINFSNYASQYKMNLEMNTIKNLKE